MFAAMWACHSPGMKFSRRRSVALRDDTGSVVIEYGLIIAVIALFLASSGTLLVQATGDLFGRIATTLAEGPGPGDPDPPGGDPAPPNPPGGDPAPPGGDPAPPNPPPADPGGKGQGKSGDTHGHGKGSGGGKDH